MADFSPSGIIDLPAMTLESLERGGDPRVLGWIREGVQEGDRLNRSDPAYDKMEVGMNYVAGFQRPGADGPAGPTATGSSPSYIPGIQINESRRVVQGHVSALTDLRPVFAYKSMNPAFSLQADLINKLTIAWWITSMADLQLGNAIKYALCGGTGDLVIDWDKYANFYGDIRISARDPRDTLPIRPSPMVDSLHGWEGLILRESHTVNALKGMFPTQQHLFRPTTDSLLSTLMGRVRRFWGHLQSPAADTLSGLDAPPMASRMRSGECLYYRTYLTDRTRNLTTKAIPMGTPGASWAYLVQPGEYLFPYKRLIVSTPDALLYDGPSPYWHGTYPVARLKLWSLPWHFYGIGLLNDLIPMQDAINATGKDLLLGFKQWMDQQVLYNRGAVSETFMRLFDPRKPGAKVKMNDTGAKEGFKKLEGPPPAVLGFGLQTLMFLIEKFNDLSGTPNLQELLALRQLPNAESLQRYWEALTPELRQEGRQVEAFLRDVAEQTKVLRFQYESNLRRVAILGDAGTTLEDFDFDPKVLVPAMEEGQPGYHPDLDKALPRDVRARAFHRMIVFTIAPNSILAVNATEQKMMKLQLARGGMYDVWSLAEALEIPNYGAPPAIPLPPLRPELAQQEVMAGLMAQMQAAANPADVDAQQAAMAFTGKYTLDPMSGQWLEIRQPITVTERLIAQNMLGLGLTENPAGRKASGQAPPKQETKSDGRTTMTESRHEPGPNSNND